MVFGVYGNIFQQQQEYCVGWSLHFILFRGRGHFHIIYISAYCNLMTDK